jgi:hypothetical protein
MNIYQSEAFTRFATKVNDKHLGSYINTGDLIELFESAQPQTPEPLPFDTVVVIDRYLRDGHLIPAISAYRDATGARLKDAKDAVKAIQDSHPYIYPRRS